MNHIHTHPERVKETRTILKVLQDDISIYGWNPITKTYATPPPGGNVVSQTMNLVAALQYASNRGPWKGRTKKSIEGTLRAVEKAAMSLHLANKPIVEIKRRDVRSILDQIRADRGGQEGRIDNLHRSWLQGLWKQLVLDDLVDTNVVNDIPKVKMVRKIRQTITPQQRKAITKHLATEHPAYLRFIQVFFGSGSRISELLRLEVKDVDLKKGEYKATVLKGNRPEEVIRPIIDANLPIWKEHLKGHKTGWMFSSDTFLPGAEKMREELPTKTWLRLVKKGLGVTADLYSLKHLASDEVAEALDIAAVQALNSQKSSTTAKVYAQGEVSRELKRVKKAGKGL